MADSSDSSPLSTLRSLAADEEASAAVEFIVLIPVYLLLMTALWMFTNLAMVRQGLVQASRFHVWSVSDPNNYTNFMNGDSFFSGQGEWETEPTRTREPVSLWAGEVMTGDLLGDEAHDHIAAHVLNNGGDPAFWKVTGTLTYKYTGLTVFGLGDILQTTQSGVLLPRLANRAEYDAEDGATNAPADARNAMAAHPALWWTTKTDDDGVGSSKDKYFDPSEPEKMPLSPFFDSGEREFPDPDPDGGGDMGIWKTDARIRGGDGGEHEYYQPRLKASTP